LWIGCSDSRVPANEIIGLLPGEVFVHRNIANVVVHTDLNCLSVIQFAVDVLKVKHIMVVGHYGCGGVRSTIRCERVGLADNWLRHVQDVREKHDACLHRLPDENAQSSRLCELNVVEQVFNVSTDLDRAGCLGARPEPHVHGWIYGLRDGLLRDLRCRIERVRIGCDCHPNRSTTTCGSGVTRRRFCGRARPGFRGKRGHKKAREMIAGFEEGEARSDATKVAAVGGADLDELAGLDEERDLDDEAGFEVGGLLDVAGGVALHAIGALNDLQGNCGGQSMVNGTSRRQTALRPCRRRQVVLHLADHRH
jgi:carbonic anhydrase